MLRLVIFSLLFCLTLQYKNPCVMDADCPPNSHCQDSKVCFCKSGFVDDLQEQLLCLKVATNVGDPCQESIQCQSGLGPRAECYLNSTDSNIGFCRCINGSHFSSGMCYSSSIIGDKCNISDECVIKTQNIKANCQNGVCVCPLEHHSSLDNTNCVPDSGLMSFCSENSDCKVKHSECVGVCKCKLGFVASQNKTLCLTAHDKLGAWCLEDDQCNQHIRLSTCFNNTCQCQNYTHQVNYSCYVTHYIDDVCEINEQCVTTSNNYSTFGCISGRCGCYPGFKRVKSDCVSPGSASFISAVSFWFLLPLIISLITLRS